MSKAKKATKKTIAKKSSTKKAKPGVVSTAEGVLTVVQTEAEADTKATAQIEAFYDANVEPMGQAAHVVSDEMYQNLVAPYSLGARLKSYIQYYWTMFQRKLPRLVWYGDELDVLITFTKDKLDLPSHTGEIPGWLSEQVNPQLPPDGVGNATIALHKAGILFDTGFGPRGRDWFFDYSLRGPVRVKFLGRTKNTLVRQE